MNPLEGINYEAGENRFIKCEKVKSRLVYGDPENVPKPFVTVVVPTYRRVHLLKQALESIITQRETDFAWDIVVVDNEPDNGKENDTERLIRSLRNDRILLYRNSENIWAGDNFNRCILLARGKWVMMLHDDDMLIANSLDSVGKLIKAYDTPHEPLGAIVASYIQVEYDPRRDETKENIPELNSYFSSLPVSYNLYRLTHNNVRFLSHVGGAAPTNGTTLLRQAIIDAGGFNEDWGISGDLILFYNLESKYAVYQTTSPLGFYRWGNNSMMESDSVMKVIRDNFYFREYIYKKSPIIGKLFRNCHYKYFASFAIQERLNVCGEQISLSDYDSIYSKRPNALWYLLYRTLIVKGYSFHKRIQSKKNEAAAQKRMQRSKSLQLL